MFLFNAKTTAELSLAAQNKPLVELEPEIAIAYASVKKSYKIDIPQQATENFVKLLKQLKDKQGLPILEKQLYGDDILSATEQEYFKTWQTQIKPHFTLKHGTKDAFEFDTLKSTGQLETEALAHNNSRTTRNPLKHNVFFVLGLGEEHPTPAFTGGNTNVIGARLGHLTSAQAKQFKGLWVSSHLEDYSRSRAYHPIAFAGSKRAITFDKESLSKTITYLRPDGTKLSRNIHYKEEIFVAEPSLDTLLDALFYQFILELRYLGPEFHHYVMQNQHNTILTIAIYNQIFQSWIYPEAKLPRTLPLTANYVWRSKGDDAYYAKVQAYFKAAENGDCPALKTLLQQGIPVDILDPDNKTAFVHCIDRNKLDAAILLLEHGADPSFLFHTSIFGFSSRYFDKRLFDKLLTGTSHHSVPVIKYHVDFNINEAFKQEMLNAAFESGKDFEHFYYLLDNGLIISDNMPLIAMAYRSGKKHAARELARVYPAHINVPFKSGQTALMLAAEKGDEETCRLLLELGAKPNLQLIDDYDEFGKNANWTAAHFAALEGHTNIIKLLQEFNANLELANKRGDTPYFIVKNALAAGISGFFKYRGYDISLAAEISVANERLAADSASSQLNFSAKLFTSQWQTYEKKLIELEAYLLTQAINHTPPVKTAQQTCTAHAINSVALITGTIKGERCIILVRKADFTGKPYGFLLGPGGIKDATDTSTAMTIRREFKEELGLEIKPEQPLQLIYSFQHATANHLWTQIDFYHCDLATALEDIQFEAGSDVAEVMIIPWAKLDKRTGKDLSKLYYRGNRIQQSNALLLEAIINGQIIDQALLEKIIHVEQYGEHLLKVALTENNLQAIDDLCEQGFDLSKTHLLITACLLGNRPFVEELLAKGALINKMYRGMLNIGFATPLVASIIRGHFELAKFLIEQHGADINVYHNGYSPLMLACISRQDGFINYLLDRGAILEQGIGGAALMMAMLNDNEPLVMRLLASKKIDINKPYELPGNFGMASMQFPLWFAARSCMSEKYVRLLLAHGANPLVTPCAPRKLSEAMKMDMHSIEASLYQFELALDKHYSSLFSMKPKESKEVLQARKIVLATIKDILDEAEKNYSTKPDDLSMPLSKVSLHI